MTNYQELFKLEVTTYTEKKNANRIGAVMRNCQKAENGYKFRPLTSEAFADDKKEYTAYKNAVDLYMKALYTDVSTPAKDKALIKVLCYLSATAEQIESLKKGNVHKTVLKAVLRNRQAMTAEGKAELKTLNERMESVLSGVIEKDGEKIALSESAIEAETEKIKAERLALYSSAVFEKAELSQVTLGTFIKTFELFIGNYLNGNNIVANYVTAEERQLNKRWRNLEKKSADINISKEEFEKYFKLNDHKGLKALIEKKKAEAEAKASA